MTDRAGQWIAAMRGGRFEEAWAMSAEDLAARDPATRDDPALPYHRRWVWDGRAFAGREVLVRCYHGLGDTIQYARFLPLLAASAASVTVEAQPRLTPLLSTLDADLAFHPFDPARPLPPAQCDVGITELPFALRAGPGAILVPYLETEPALLPAGTIGLCWSAGDWDAERCIAPELFGAVATRHACVTLVAGPTALPVANPEGCPFDIDETAALVAGCDLVVTVDTMIAHLAGALGRPTWLLLKAEPDWRWTPDAPTTPWYPTMRVYTQDRSGDWAGVLAAVERDLALSQAEGCCR